MSKNRDLKVAKVEEIKEKLNSSKSVILVDYHGLSVDDATNLRNRFREEGVEYKVYKNRLVKIAVEGTDYESLKDELVGPNAIAFGIEDAVVPARIVKEFAKKKPALELKSGVIEGVFYDKENLIKIADIPSREVLLAKFMGSINSPVSKFAYLVKAIADQKGEE